MDAGSGRGASKYAPLAAYLRDQTADEVTLTLDEISRIVPGGLPPSARRERTWWANTHTESQAASGWLAADWRVLTVDLPRQQVTFIHSSSERWHDRDWVRRPDVPRAWFVRPAMRAQDEVQRWLADGYCQVATPGELPDVRYTSHREIAEALRREYPHLTTGARAALASTLNTFVGVMKEGDLIATIGGDVLYIGQVVGGPEAVEEEGRPPMRRRAVEWRNRDDPARLSDLSGPLQSRLRGERTVIELTAELPELEQLVRPLPTPTAERVAAPSEEVTAPPLPGATPELAKTLHLPIEWLDDAIDILRDSKQMILYGPPGTGKTYLARAIAEHVATVANVRLVQFHPGYSYEDFVEGYRPLLASSAGQLQYEVAWGPFRRLAKEASDNPDNNYVMVIDEINRAHPAKVFGELYFLLEYRDEPVQLQYSRGGDEFRLPKNIYLIGTMNTADRSIALMDVALRRRFAFLELHPSEAPINRLLRTWLEGKGVTPRVADLLDELNRRIDDRDARIGPAYFMNERAIADDGDRGLRRIWDTKLLPLLAEQFYGQGRNIQDEFGFDAIRDAVGGAGGAGPGAPGGAGSSGPGPAEPGQA